MNLKQLFSEGDFGTPSPQTPADTLAVIEALKRARWSMRQLDTFNSTWDVEELANYLKSNNIKTVTTNNFMMFADISRYNNNSEFVEPLRQVYFPNIDVPPPSKTDVDFHTDDEFESDEHMLLGFEFVISGANGEIEIDGMASLADTNREIELTRPIRKYIFDRYVETIKQLGVLLSQS